LCFGSQTWCGVGIISGHRNNAVFGTDDDDDDDEEEEEEDEDDVSLGTV
jgi:hypothetical protein